MPASVYVCQWGCGTFEEDHSKMHERGIVNPKLYCSKCIGDVDAYLAERDRIHTHLAEKWSRELAETRKMFDEEGRRFPDD